MGSLRIAQWADEKMADTKEPILFPEELQDDILAWDAQGDLALYYARSQLLDKLRSGKVIAPRPACAVH